ncbi:hypothetical protein A3A49_01840 [Candidatus Curtissbacteria bacterium RIFCSPLOWO2_01_FULL_38_11b]|uniref:Aspartyl/glutamyl-tRNA(Asn/Gln) amidotransferase subunit B n=1 Tax=Candidatus Curtissbacteria bacterium RIFCSPLOWO2_01_FULL_38_11b TaxID=1797725 RepID=A0A1F5H1I0_9BACT|nr:MAG: hypothetical protein A3A49_01840 [Candidatus Curtissbacteria bacterium RIFCSPLOWO2_01_FULL_38_11b]
MSNSKYQPVIGLEVHIELSTQSKMFCTCSADYFTKEPNTHTCPVCLGLPGALPVPNKKAIEWCVMIGLVLNCQIPLFSKFDRKNYFYPDLAKGYQISQYDKPFCVNGSITLSNGKKIGINRAHMEEDTGKLTHATIDGKRVSLIDFNRSGVPLVEIVTEPDFESAQEATEYLKYLQRIVRYLGVSNADMEKGDMRLEPNISLRKVRDIREVKKVQKVTQVAQELPPYKVEVKNINSFKFVEKAINYELERQSELLDKGQTPVQETRGWNEQKQVTLSQRSKEEAHDYRYFPEPDLPPLSFDHAYIQGLKEKLPELPDAKLKRFAKQYRLSLYDAQILTRDRNLADYFEEAAKAAKVHDIDAKQIANNIINKKPDIEKILPATFVEQIYETSQVATIPSEKLDKIVQDVLAKNIQAVEDYKKGKENVIMFLVGQVMNNIPEKVDANLIKKNIEDLLK